MTDDPTTPRDRPPEYEPPVAEELPANDTVAAAPIVQTDHA